MGRVPDCPVRVPDASDASHTHQTHPRPIFDAVDVPDGPDLVGGPYGVPEDVLDPLTRTRCVVVSARGGDPRSYVTNHVSRLGR